jgi:hypothetical protein
MFDIATIAAIATSTVSVLSPLLQKAAEKGAEEVGKSAVSGLLPKFKARLTHEGSKEALADLSQQPTDVAAQGALVMQLRKAVAAEPDLASFLQKWSDECKSESYVSQVASVQGDQNKVTQIVGSGNSVT